MRKVEQVGQLFGTDKEPNPSGGRVYSANGLMRTLGGGHGMSQPYILEYPRKVISTRGNDYVGAIRASYYKCGERNLIKNVTEGLGYEGIIEYY